MKHFPKHTVGKSSRLHETKQANTKLKKKVINKCDPHETVYIMDYVFFVRLFSSGPVIGVHHTT
jgi:hypothetical protein